MSSPGTGGPTPGPRFAALLRRWAAVDEMVRSPVVVGNLVGCSPAWTVALRQVVEVALFTDAAVLISGESGTGKELVARLLHTLDRRPKKGDLVVLDCTTIVPELAGSKSSATNAVPSPMPWRLGTADSHWPTEGRYSSTRWARSPSRSRPTCSASCRSGPTSVWAAISGTGPSSAPSISTTNRDLFHEESQGRIPPRFLLPYCRMYVQASTVARSDGRHLAPDSPLPLLQFRPDLGAVELDEPVRQYLLRRAYPGNVRDLRQLISRIACRHVGPGPITVGDIPDDERPDPPDRPARLVR